MLHTHTQDLFLWHPFVVISIKGWIYAEVQCLIYISICSSYILSIPYLLLVLNYFFNSFFIVWVRSFFLCIKGTMTLIKILEIRTLSCLNLQCLYCALYTRNSYTISYLVRYFANSPNDSQLHRYGELKLRIEVKMPSDCNIMLIKQ